MNIQAAATEMIRLAQMVGPEDEGLDLSDLEYTIEQMAHLRSELSGQRRAIDMVNKALAQAWDVQYGNGVYEDEFKEWYLGRAKGKRVIDPDTFYAWLATKDADELARLVSASAIKVGGMTPAERDSLLDETSTQKELSINNRERR